MKPLKGYYNNKNPLALQVGFLLAIANITYFFS